MCNCVVNKKNNEDGKTCVFSSCKVDSKVCAEKVYMWMCNGELKHKI